MKLLIITQKVDKNDPILGFFHRWIIEFAKHCESLVVICLEKGVHELPANVRVLSLGKETGKSHFKYLWRFYSYIWKERNNYDKVFVHMNPIYVVLGGLCWRILGKKISLWYTHKNVDWKLRVAEKIIHKAFTASKESFRLPSKKVQVMGHGIDVDYFSPRGPLEMNDTIKLLTIGRISAVKNYQLIIDCVRALKKSGEKVLLTIVGGPVTCDDEIYEHDLKKSLARDGLSEEITWAGAIPQDQILPYLQNADIFINTSNTGSLDKAVLEAMACGVKVLTSNEAFRSILGAENITSGSLDDMVVKINALSKSAPDSHSREYIVKNHNLKILIPRLVESMETI